MSDKTELSSEEVMVMALEQIVKLCGSNPRTGFSTDQNALYRIKDCAINALATRFVQCEGCLRWVDERDLDGGICNTCESRNHE